MTQNTKVSFRMPARWKKQIGEIMERDGYGTMSEFINMAIGSYLTFDEINQKRIARKKEQGEYEDDNGYSEE